MEITPCIPESVLVSSQLTKIARRSWNFIVEKLKYNATGRCGIDGNVKLSSAWIGAKTFGFVALTNTLDLEDKGVEEVVKRRKKLAISPRMIRG